VGIELNKIIDLKEPEEIFFSYKRAYKEKGSFLIVEYMDYYNLK